MRVLRLGSPSDNDLNGFVWETHSVVEERSDPMLICMYAISMHNNCSVKVVEIDDQNNEVILAELVPYIYLKENTDPKVNWRNEGF